MNSKEEYNEVIKIDSLHKSYENIKAVNGISLSLERGEMFGLVGPDGAGKTTTIRILCGLLGYKNGNVSLLNKDLKNDRSAIQKNIGYLSQKFSLYGDLTIDENIEFFAKIHNVRKFRNRRDELLDFTRLSKFRDRLANNLSGGMKQKLALACSLIHKPKILFLDEPTTGVDPVSRRDFWKILSGLRKDGITIFMSTPYLDEAERCTTVALMNNGEIIANDTPENIKKSINKDVLEIVCTPVKEALKSIKSKTNFDVQMFGDRINLVLESYEKNKISIEKILSGDNVRIISTRKLTPSLENVFIYKIQNT